MEYPIEIINLARIINLAQASKNHFEKFLLQQNLIQYNLVLLIMVRSKLPDKRFLEWVENKTLGELIQLYKVCANREEKPLLSNLGQYNTRRKYLVHGIFKDKDFNRIDTEAKNANVEGTRIVKELEKLLTNEIRRAKK